MKIDNVLDEMSVEIGTKNGKSGYRTFIGGKMLDKTPPETKVFADKILEYIKSKGWLDSFSKFDIEKIDVETMGDGSVVLTPEEGVSFTISKEKVKEITKDI